jgi:hypothetical protein
VLSTAHRQRPGIPTVALKFLSWPGFLEKSNGETGGQLPELRAGIPSEWKIFLKILKRGRYEKYTAKCHVTGSSISFQRVGRRGEWEV